VDKRIQEDNLQHLALFSEYGRMALAQKDPVVQVVRVRSDNTALYCPLCLERTVRCCVCDGYCVDSVVCVRCSLHCRM
jgi:hypothetical protein